LKMSAEKKELFETVVKVDTKDIFVVLKQNSDGAYLRISEKTPRSRSSIAIPLSGVNDIKKALDAAVKAGSNLPPLEKSSREPRAPREPREPRERKPRHVSEPEVIARSLYVSGLSYDINDESLLNHFAKSGAIKATVMTRTRGRSVVSRGCGVVEFRNSADAKRAVAAYNETTLDGRTIKCREDRSFEEIEKELADAPPRQRRERTPRSEENRILVPTKMFVTSLNFDTTSEDLINFVGTLGDVVSCELLTSKAGRSLGHAIVEFTNSRDTTEAIERFNGKDLDGRTISTRPYYTFL